VHAGIIMAGVALMAAWSAWGQATPTQPSPTPGTVPGAAPTTPTRPASPQFQQQERPQQQQQQRPTTGTTIGIDARTTAPTTPTDPTAPPSDGVAQFDAVSGRVMGPQAISGAGRGSGVGVAHSGQGFEPYLQREIEYRDDEVPTGGSIMTLTTQEGTMGAIQFLDALYLATDWNILVTPEVEPIQMRFWMVEVTPQEALEILKFNDIYYEYNPETEFIYFMTKEEYLRRRYAAVVREEFVIRHTDINDAQAVIQSLASPGARMISDPRTATVIVWDTIDNLEEMHRTLSVVDVPADPVRFTLAHLNADDMVDALFDLLSQRGVAYTDPRTNTLIVEDLPERIARICEFIELVDIPHETRRWTLNHIEPGEIANRIEDLVPPGTGDMIIDDRVHQITVTTLPDRLEKIDERIKLWDIPRRQVELAAYIVAASKDVSRELGVSWAYFDESSRDGLSLTRGGQRPTPMRVPDSGQLFQLGTVPYQVPLRNRITGEPLQDIGGNIIPDPQLRMGGLSVVLNYLDQRGDITIMSRPRVTVIDGEEATIQNTTDQPFQEGGFRDTGGTGDQFGFNRVIPLRVQFITVGTILKVRPVINEQNTILLDINAEDSTAEPVTVTTGDQASTIPQKTESRTNTRVMVHNQHTIVLGGLQNAAMTGSEDRMPLLGDLPFVGRLFRNTTAERRQRELMIFITPTIVDEFSQPESEKLVRLTDNIGMELFKSRQSLLRRVEDRLSKGERTISITISQTGELRLESEPVDFIELEAVLAEMNRAARVVVSPHGRAPSGLDQAVMDAVARAGLEGILYDERSVFVPYYELPDWAREAYGADPKDDDASRSGDADEEDTWSTIFGDSEVSEIEAGEVGQR
jgi:type II secretory pathway component GspD/PulD (secretin)